MKSKYCTAIVVMVICFVLSGRAGAQEKLMVFCGAAFRQPMEEIVALFSAKTGTAVNVIYGGVGSLFSQIVLTKRGDVLIVPSAHIMEQARLKGLIRGSVDTVAYVVPSISVQKGNPKSINGLKDLTRPSVRVAIANPETVYIGMVAVEIAEKTLSPEEKKAFKKNIVTYPEDVNKLEMLLFFKKVDAIVGLHYLGMRSPDKVDTVKLKTDEIQRIGAGQIGILSQSGNTASAEAFKRFVASGESKKIFAKYRFFATADDAFLWLGGKKPVGGERPAPASWFKNE